MTRQVLLVTHRGRRSTLQRAERMAELLGHAGFGIRVLAGEADALRGVGAVPVAEQAAAYGIEIVVALGGDGTLLRAAEVARPAGVPLLGVNLGRVGFLAEVEADKLEQTVDHIATCDYVVEERLTVDVTVRRNGQVTTRGWALNEASVEKAARERMLELLVKVDGRSLSRWACDGVICATPTGSTAYAFSAGGPVVWPEVEALLLVPISAHALFARPLVTSPTSVLTVDVAPGAAAVLFCDGRRTVMLPSGSQVEVRRGELPVRVVRLHPQPFTDRLVAKFALPIEGWRGSVNDPLPG